MLSNQCARAGGTCPRDHSRASVALKVIAVITSALVGAGSMAIGQPAEVVIPAGLAAGTLSKKEQDRVNDAIEQGIGYLRRVQVPNGSFGDGDPAKHHSKFLRFWPEACAALGGLAMLECEI